MQVLPLLSYAQFKLAVELTGNEKVLYDNSKDEFFNEDYVGSYQGFSQLLSLYPREEVFNYYYGACLVKLNNNIKSGIDYLEYAANKGINPANFYIGLGYHYMYNFDKALDYYNIYKLNAKQKDIVNFEVEQYLSMAKNGIDLVKYAYELKVISNKKVNRNNFQYSYNLNDFGGDIIVKTNQFKGKADKYILETDLMYISKIYDILFYSSYGDSKKNSLDIYMSRKSNNIWSAPQKLPATINTNYDEAYPFLSEDGVTLYFSSKGHSSMGGYDIFQTVWNSSTNQWSEPQNMDFPINTPFDDIMYAVDRYNETAFFASNRDTKIDKISVFRILTEADPQQRKLDNLTDIYKHANLDINPLAVTELTKRQEIRITSLIDTSNTGIVSIDSNINMEDVDVLIQNAISLLDEKADIAAGYLEYAASAYKLTEIRLAEIKDLNKQISSLKSKTDAKSISLKDSLSNIINQKALEAADLYDISKYFADASSKTNGIIEHYRNEMKILDNTSRKERTLMGDVKKIDAEIRNIKIDFPFETYLSKLEKEKSDNLARLNTYSSKNEPELKKLDNLNDKIFLKYNLAIAEEDFEVREKYVYDLKSYENEKIDVITKIKANEVQIEFLNHETVAIDDKIEMTEKFRLEIENGLIYDPLLNISKLNNEVELLKTSVSQNTLKELASVQDRILSDTRLYSPIVDYDGILYGTALLTESELNPVFVDTEKYSEKYNNILSDNTLRTGRIITENDSLKELITQKEMEFDASTDNYQKQNLITDINNAQSTINQNNELLKSGLIVENTVEIGTIISQYEEIKNNSQNDQLNKYIVETDKLIADSKQIESEISDLKIIDKTGKSPGIKYLEVVKSDIDTEIAKNVELMAKIEPQVDVVVDLKKIVADLNTSLKYSANQNKNSETIRQINNQLKNAKNLFATADRESNIEIKNDYLTQANDIILRSCGATTNFLNENIILLYSDFNTYINSLESNNLTNAKNDIFIQKAINYRKNADKLQIESEESSDEKTKLLKLSSANQEMELAIMYLNYVFEFIENQNKYNAQKSFSNSGEATDLIAGINSIEKRELIPVNNILVQDVNPEILSTIIAEAGKIQIKIDKLKTEYSNVNATRQKDILAEVENLNNDLDKKLLDLNTEIAKAQKEIIIANFNQLELENPGEKYTTLENEVAKHNELVNKSVDQQNYQMLGEVIIAGENLLKKQNDLLKTKTILQDHNTEIVSLNEAAVKNLDFVTQQSLIAQNNILAQNDTVNQIDTAQNIILVQNDTVNQIDTAQNIVIVQNDTVNQIDTAQNIILVQNDTVNQLDITQNNNLTLISSTSISELTDKLRENNIINNLDSLVASISNYENQISNNTVEISALNERIANASNANTKQKLNTDLIKIEKSQTELLIEQSKTSVEFINELEKIVNSGNKQIAFATATAYKNLLLEHKDLRNSIINYNNFYSIAELQNLNNKSASVEQKLTQLLLEETKNIDPVLLANNINQDGNAAANNVISNTNNVSEDYNFEYNYDKETLTRLNKSENKLIALDRQIAENKKLMADMEKSMESSNSLSEYKKIEKNLKKAQKRCLIQVKQYAEINNVYLTTKYEFADAHYTDNLLPAGNSIRPVSDSLKSDSEYDLNESLAIYETIVNYNGKIINNDLMDKFANASELSTSGINKINLANNLIIKNDANDPTVLSYYKTLSINENNQANNNDISLDSSLNIVDNVHQNNNDIILNDTVIASNINNDTNIQNNDNTNDNNTLADNNFSVLKTENNIIDALAGSLYSDSNPIKTLEISEELCYRIQIGAFYQPVENDKLRGLSPIFMETTANSKLLRYVAGTFYTFNSARTSLPAVQKLGYTDAFIIAYYNGKRISINEARQIEDRLTKQAQSSDLAINNNTNQNNTLVTNQTDTVSLSNENIVANTDLKKTNDVFYCVQIGVYKEKVNPERLYNLNPVMYDEYGNGLIRHTFGKYYDLNDAIAEQNKIRQLGIKDAFVIAYNNGEKISLNEAKTLIGAKSNLPDDQVVVNIAPNLNNNENLQQEENNPPQVRNSSVAYYVQLGAFRTDVISWVKDSFKKLAGANKLYKLSSSDIIVYRIGTFSKYSDAQISLATVKAGGITDAFIIAIIDGKRVDLATARAAE